MLYVGVTRDLEKRIIEHYQNRNNPKTFAGRYNCHYLVYYEAFKYVKDAIAREKQLKHFSRTKKDRLITEFNPKWRVLNYELFGKWPPDGIL